MQVPKHNRVMVGEFTVSNGQITTHARIRLGRLGSSSTLACIISNRGDRARACVDFGTVQIADCIETRNPNPSYRASTGGERWGKNSTAKIECSSPKRNGQPSGAAPNQKKTAHLLNACPSIAARESFLLLLDLPMYLR